MNWSWTYPQAQGGLGSCTTCPDLKSVLATDPAGVVSRHTFGISSQVNEGRLLQLDEGWNGSFGLRSTAYQYRDMAAGPYPSPAGYSGNPRSDALVSQYHTPQSRRTTTQQGVDFVWQANSFDSFARALSVTRASSLGHSKTETTAYDDHLGKWMLGRLASVTDSSGVVEQRTTYSPTTGLPTASHTYGRLVESYTHHANGLLNVQTDAAGRGTAFSNHMRGVPQTIAYADATAESAVVNSLGWVTAITNAASTTTSYGYDAAGRLASISHPSEPGLAYHPTTLRFEPVAAAEYGIAAGHWRQTVSTGNARTVRYLDALWRTRLERSWDAANEAATSRTAETRYDAGGRPSFVSYPQRNLSGVDGALPGTRTVYDALGRVTGQTQDSELGALSTTTAYPGNFQKRVTDARGHASTFGYQVTDQPSDDRVTLITAPEGVNVTIIRDVFGKALAITRSGGGVSATRSYAYDVHQRPCKTIEPESGATVQAYDTAGNLQWRASGLTLPNPFSCDQASVPAVRRIDYGYDTRNRLTSTSFGDGSPGVGRSYTADGLPWQLWSAGSTWTYGYNNRRTLVSEVLSYAGANYALGWGIDAYGHVAALAYPDGATVALSPNALGQPTQVSGHASAIAYHPNGALAGYTLANGMAHSVVQNTRGLPQLWRDAGVLQDAYSYDANGNVLSIADQQQGITSRSLGYDGLDRLTQASGVWGAGSYAYDALDNLRASTVGGRSLSHNIDAATNRLASLSGSQSVGFAYDANGNLTQRGAQGFVFDIGNRLQSATGKASYSYDGHGRRIRALYADGSSKLQVYGQGGKLLFSQHSNQGSTRHVYLGDKLIAEVNSSLPARL